MVHTRQVSERLSEQRLEIIKSYGEAVPSDDDGEPSPVGGPGDENTPDTSAHIYDPVAGAAILANRRRSRKAHTA